MVLRRLLFQVTVQATGTQMHSARSMEHSLAHPSRPTAGRDASARPARLEPDPFDPLNYLTRTRRARPFELARGPSTPPARLTLPPDLSADSLRPNSSYSLILVWTEYLFQAHFYRLHGSQRVDDAMVHVDHFAYDIHILLFRLLFTSWVTLFVGKSYCGASPM